LDEIGSASPKTIGDNLIKKITRSNAIRSEISFAINAK
jgi:hypothetical protein